MKILIIEDEKLVAKELLELLTTSCPEAVVLDIIDSVESGVEWFENNQMPDLILSDIQLADGVSFEIFEGRSIMAPVIFTTAYDEYALRAFQLNSIDYLLKPIGKKELSRALTKFSTIRRAAAPDFLRQQFEYLMQDLKNGRKFKTRFIAHQGQSMVPVQIDKVAGFIKDELIFLLTRSGRKLMTDYHTLDELQELLDDTIFYRANRQLIIHTDAVLDFKTHYTGKLILHVEGHINTQVVVSREKASAFKRWFEAAD